MLISNFLRLCKRHWNETAEIGATEPVTCDFGVYGGKQLASVRKYKAVEDVFVVRNGLIRLCGKLVYPVNAPVGESADTEKGHILFKPVLERKQVEILLEKYGFELPSYEWAVDIESNGSVCVPFTGKFNRGGFVYLPDDGCEE